MTNEFKWTDELITEFFTKWLSNDLCIPEQMQKFKESKQPKPEWKILSLKHGNTLYTWTDRNKTFCYEGPGQDVSLDWALENGFEINSVNRLSDNLVVKVGDMLGHRLGDACFEVDHFEIQENDIYAVNDVAEFGSSARKSFSCRNWKKQKEILFISEDACAIYEGNQVAILSTDNWLISSPVTTPEKPFKGNNDQFKYFSTKEAAEEYIIDHKPLLSLSEVIEAYKASNTIDTFANSLGSLIYKRIRP